MTKESMTTRRYVVVAELQRQTFEGVYNVAIADVIHSETTESAGSRRFHLKVMANCSSCYRPCRVVAARLCFSLAISTFAVTDVPSPRAIVNFEVSCFSLTASFNAVTVNFVDSWPAEMVTWPG